MKLTVASLGPFVGQISKPLSHYSQFRPASLTMQQYLDFGRTGTPKTSFLFLKTELLVRMANIMSVYPLFFNLKLKNDAFRCEFDLLPAQLLQTPSAKLVGDWYRKSFEERKKFLIILNDSLQKASEALGKVLGV
jgi:hypothetical protein